MSDATPVRLLILGTGGMAGAHAIHFGSMPGVELVAGVDVRDEQLNAFCDTHKIEMRFTDLAAALAWGEFDAVANVTPDHVHYHTTMECLAAGKHVFCEKPLAVNHDDAEEMTRTAALTERVAMVNLTYRNVPALQQARTMVLAGEIGDIKHVEASYLQSWLTGNHWGDWRTEPKWLWRLSKSHGSNGALGDVGIHILDFAIYGSGLEIVDLTCRLKAFHKAEDDWIGEYHLDANDSFVMTVEFENGALGTVHSSRWASGHANDLSLRMYGDKGGLEVGFGGKDEKGLPVATLRACLGDSINTQKWVDVPLTPVDTNYQRFIAAVRSGVTQEPSFAHASNLQRLLDQGLADAST